MMTFENLETLKDEKIYNKRNTKIYRLIGKFIGFDGEMYVALETQNMYKDHSYLKFQNFIRDYYVK